MENTYYLDTSALAKRYFQEPGSAFLNQLFAKNFSFYTSVISYAEFYASLHRLYREGLLSLQTKEAIAKDFEYEWEQLLVIDFTDEVRVLTPGLTAKFPLRGADAIQMASAISLKEHGLRPTFLTADKRLFNSAQDYGLPVLNPAEKDH